MYFRLFLLCLLGCTCNQHSESTQKVDRFAPYDHQFHRQYTPFDTIVPGAELKSLAKAKKHARFQRSLEGTWQTEGPANIGARINTVAVSPINAQHILVGFSGGGAYRTENGGMTWTAVFDQNEFLAIGDIVFSPHDPSHVLMSTGDPNISGFPFLGNGLFQSQNGGRTWSALGLEDVGILSKVSFHPTLPGTIYASSMGIPYQRDHRRGLYRSEDGGTSWEQILQLGEQTGVIDFVQHPNRPEEIYAAGWDRIRSYSESLISGPGAKVHRSLDGGMTWDTLVAGLPQDDLGRIGLALAPSNPDRIYALYVNTNSQLHSIHTSSDQGATWTELATDALSGLGTSALGGFGWYFGKIRVDPSDELSPYLLGVDLWKYNPRSQRWQQPIGSPVHADKHDLVFCGTDTLILATDGGLYRSTDGGTIYQDIESIPATQFYRVDYNPHVPDLIWAGAQDNGISKGNNLLAETWVRVSGADGFRTLFHPEDSLTFYVESQRGGLSVTTNGGISFARATAGVDGSDRKNWDLPVLISRHDPDVLYYGTTRVYRSENGTVPAFTPISDHLTDELIAYAPTSTITAMAESNLNPDILVAGTGDGNLWSTNNRGTTWNPIGRTLPDRWYTSIHFSDQSDDLYVTQTGYKDGHFVPLVYRSSDLGQVWESLASDLPESSINDVLILPNHGQQVLFAATDAGVYFTTTGAERWERLGVNFPFIPTYELTFNPEKNTLLAATFGKSILSFDINQIDFSEPVSIAEHIVDVRIFPNPADHALSISGLEHRISEMDWTATDMSGRRFSLPDRGATLDLSSISAGHYILHGRSNQKLYLGRFVKM